MTKFDLSVDYIAGVLTDLIAVGNGHIDRAVLEDHARAVVLTLSTGLQLRDEAKMTGNIGRYGCAVGYSARLL